MSTGTPQRARRVVLSIIAGPWPAHTLLSSVGNPIAGLAPLEMAGGFFHRGVAAAGMNSRPRQWSFLQHRHRRRSISSAILDNSPEKPHAAASGSALGNSTPFLLTPASEQPSVSDPHLGIDLSARQEYVAHLTRYWKMLRAQQVVAEEEEALAPATGSVDSKGDVCMDGIEGSVAGAFFPDRPPPPRDFEALSRAERDLVTRQVRKEFHAFHASVVKMVRSQPFIIFYSLGVERMPALLHEYLFPACLFLLYLFTLIACVCI